MATSPPRASTSAHGHELSALIIALCERNGLATGSRLPTERQLATELGVTRTVIRNALALLEAEGRISRQVGRGTFMRASVRAGGTLADAVAAGADVSPADVMAARRLIEPQVLPLVVSWATARDFDEMRRCLQGGEAAQSAEEFEVWDFALHHAIVAASRNQLLREMYASIERARKGEIWGNLKRRNDSRDRRAQYQQDHIELVDALSAREVTRAVEVMDAHLARVEANLLA
jgi:DNA-binding FadR family transcriptional regulator